ncbi:DsbA family protein [Alicycliphilus denitrificans]|uniref:DsbA family oxidoreductase n=1 Tax=Alicycliphilus denitrificans TaxID=179636 RepID=UPI00384E8C98
MPAATPITLKIDFVSDVVCPWCAIGLAALTQAAGRLAGQVQLDWHFQPFELNPGMGPGGEDLIEHLAGKYGATPEQLQQTQAQIASRGASLGFVFGPQRTRIYNTFDAHRLLHWLGEEGGAGQQLAFKRALLTSYFTDGENPADPGVLLKLVGALGLDEARARAVLESAEYADAVREREDFYRGQGIHSVPAVIVNDRHLIQGGQPVEVFEQALRQIAAQQP